MRNSPILRRIGREKVTTFVQDVGIRTMRCRSQHGCNILPFEHGMIATVLAGAVAHDRILELGTGIGFSTLWLAYGARSARIDTIDGDAEHIKQARENCIEFGVADRVTLHQAAFEDVLPTLQFGYDLALFDGWLPKLRYLDQFERLLRCRGVLITSNLMYAVEAADVAEVDAYRERLYGDLWQSNMLDDSNIVSVRQ